MCSPQPAQLRATMPTATIERNSRTTAAGATPGGVRESVRVVWCFVFKGLSAFLQIERQIPGFAIAQHMDVDLGLGSGLLEDLKRLLLAVKVLAVDRLDDVSIS